ncbi:MAG: FAD-binding protein, partial [Pseudooceanicola atlanticus]
IAWAIFDERIAGIARQFADFQDAEAQGAILTADRIAELAGKCRLPVDALETTMAGIGQGEDPFGRSFDADKALKAPYCAVRVTGTLFHTQGGLDVTPDARVKRSGGGVFDNLYAVGGAATGVSGTGDYGYLSGNGLLAAVVLGRKAGLNA